VLSAYGPQQGNDLRRTKVLISMLCGVIKTGKSYLHSLGSEFSGSIDLESRVKRVKRWLINERTDWQTHFIPCIEAILGKYIFENKELVFAIDGSEVGNGCTALMISLVVGKRALPVCWVVRQCKKGHLPSRMHLEVLHILHQLLGDYSNIVILGDGEFDNHQIISACKDWEWRFVFRTGKNTRIFDGSDEYAIGQLYPAKQESFMTVSNVFYTKKRHGPVHATSWHLKQWDDPIYLLSNFELAFDTLCYYRKRWSIETLFSDIKSRGFNIHKSKLSDPQRVAKLLIIVCIAYILVFKLGQASQRSTLIAKVTRKDRMDLSIFSLGKKLAAYCLKHAIPIVFSFSKNVFIQIPKSVR